MTTASAPTIWPIALIASQFTVWSNYDAIYGRIICHPTIKNDSSADHLRLFEIARGRHQKNEEAAYHPILHRPRMAPKWNPRFVQKSHLCRGIADPGGFRSDSVLTFGLL
jgi:hypothetical protein